MHYKNIRWHLLCHLENHPLRHADEKTRAEYLYVLEKIADTMTKNHSYTNAVRKDYEGAFASGYELTDAERSASYRSIFRYRICGGHRISYRYFLLFDCFILCGVQDREDCKNIIYLFEDILYAISLSPWKRICFYVFRNYYPSNTGKRSPLQEKVYTFVLLMVTLFGVSPADELFSLCDALHGEEYPLYYFTPEIEELFPFWCSILDKMYSEYTEYEMYKSVS